MSDFQSGRQDPSLSPGMLIHLPDRPDWGVGQIQSVIGARVTANFEDAGKQVVNSAAVAIEPVEGEER